LAELGYTGRDGKLLRPDSDYGASTTLAVTEFQKAQRDAGQDIRVTGIADAATRDAAEREVARRRDMPLPAPSMDRDIDQLQPVEPRRPSQATGVADPVLNSMRDQVYAMDRAMGRTPDEASDRVAAALTAEWRANGLTARPDGVVLGQKGDRAQPGEYVFAYSGSSERPSDWVGVKTAEAVQTPVEQSLAKSESLQRQQAMEAQLQVQAPQPGNDAPRMVMG
jgi:peptidoglycan hydrolase-like protein with peptidoglycan-binding domain